MIEHHSYFSTMRKVRVYLKKLQFYSSVSRGHINSIFYENTTYYLEGKITRKFLASLAHALLYQGEYHKIWKDHQDHLQVILKTALELGNSPSQTNIFRINRLLKKYQKYHMLPIYSPLINLLDKISQPTISRLYQWHNKLPATNAL